MMWLHSCYYTTPIALCVGEIIFLKSCFLTGDKESSEVHSQERGPQAVSGGLEEHHEEVPSLSSEETYLQNPFSQPTEEAPETPDGVECQDSGGSRTTIDLTALTRQPSNEKERLSDSPPAVPDESAPHLSDLGCERQIIEDSQGAGEESGKSPAREEAAVVECVVTEENTSVIISSAAARSSAEEQEDSQERELLDQTDACLHQKI